MVSFIKKYYFQLLVSIGFVLLIVIMIVQSMHVITMIKNKAEEFTQTQLDYSLAQEFLNHIHEFQINNDYINQNKEWMSLFLSDEDDEKVQLFATLEQLAFDTGNIDITLSVKKDIKKEKKTTKAKKTTDNTPSKKDKILNISIELVGNYNTTIAFLKKIENLKYLADVSSINMQKIDDVTKEVENEQGKKTEVVYKNMLKTKINTKFYLDN